MRLRTGLADCDLPDTLYRRALHVLSEIRRVSQAADALAAADLPGFSRLLHAGHESLRDLFEVSVPAVDVLVEELQNALGDKGGARMTGAGFGGSIVVVARKAIARNVVAGMKRTTLPVHWILGE